MPPEEDPARWGPSRGHRGSEHKILWQSVQRFQRYAHRQTDRHTDRQADCNIPLPYRGRVIRTHCGSFKYEIIVSVLVMQTLCSCYDSLFHLLSSYFCFLFSFLFNLFSPKSALCSPAWKQAQSHWNLNAMCRMVSIRVQLVFQQSDLIYWRFLGHQTFLAMATNPL